MHARTHARTHARAQALDAPLVYLAGVCRGCTFVTCQESARGTRGRVGGFGAPLSARLWPPPSNPHHMLDQVESARPDASAFRHVAAPQPSKRTTGDWLTSCDDASAPDTSAVACGCASDSPPCCCRAITACVPCVPWPQAVRATRCRADRARPSGTRSYASRTRAGARKHAWRPSVRCAPLPMPQPRVAACRADGVSQRRVAQTARVPLRGGGRPPSGRVCGTCGEENRQRQEEERR